MRYCTHEINRMYSSMVEHLPHMKGALGSSPHSKKQKKKKKKKEQYNSYKFNTYLSFIF